MEKKARPDLSIIIPVYNTAAYLPACVESIFSQGIDSMEVICIDDGSTDRSLEALRQLGQKYPIDVLVQPENKGQSAARNLGCRHACGQYLLFVDSDDLLPQGVLPALLKRAMEQALDVLYFDGDAFMDEGAAQDDELLAHYRALYRAKQPLEDVTDGITFFDKMCDRAHYSYRVSPCLHLISKAYLDSIGLQFAEGMIYEDNLFSLQLMTQAKRVAYEHQVGYQRRIRPSSTVTSAHTWWHVQCAVRAYVEMTRYFLAQPNLQKVQDGVMLQIAAMHDQAADDYYRLSRSDKKQLKALPNARLLTKLCNHGLRYHMSKKQVCVRLLHSVKQLWL